MARKELFWFSLSWITGSVLVIAKFPAWYGGHSFGPRLQVDFFVALVLITFLLWNVMEGQGRRLAKKALMGLYLATGVLAIWIHSYQGLFNFWPHKWNALQEVSSISVNELMFDWRHPQFLATRESVLETLEQHFGPERYIVDVVEKERDWPDIYAIRRKPDDCESFVARGIWHKRKSRHGSAMADFTTAIAGDGTCVEAFEQRGTLYRMREQKEAACEDWRKACDLGACMKLHRAGAEGYCNGPQGEEQGLKGME
jgi:hypothetical protein